jgi:F-type H+-transporting ATPase subunit b
MSIHASRALLRISAVVLCTLPMHGETGNIRAITGSVGASKAALFVGVGIDIKSEGTTRDVATGGGAGSSFANETRVPRVGVLRSQPGRTFGGATPSSQAQAADTEDNDVYRHSANVQSLARMMHLQVETAARLFEIFNVLILVLGIGVPLARVMPNLLRERSEKIRRDLETARRTTEDAITRLSVVEAKFASLDQEIAKFRAEVEQQIALDEQRSKAALEEEIARIAASAEQEIGIAVAQAKRSLRYSAAELAIDLAVKKLVLTPETDRTLIAEFISETRRSVGREGITSSRRQTVPTPVPMLPQNRP